MSGFNIVWDSRKPPGQRVQSVALQVPKQDQHGTGDATPLEFDLQEIEREETGRRYKVVTREYMAQGHDGYLPLKDHKYLIDDEQGQLMSSIVRKYLLGAGYLSFLAHFAQKGM